MLQEIFELSKEGQRLALAGKSSGAAVRALCAVANQLQSHMLASQQQQRLPAVFTPVASELGKLADGLEAAVASAAAQPVVGSAEPDTRRLSSLVKSFRSSFRRRGSGSGKDCIGTSSVSTNAADLEGRPLTAVRVTEKLSFTPEQHDLAAAQGDAVKATLQQLQSSDRGQQLLLRALLQQEGLQVLENCLRACVRMNATA